jgi:hypothetical protein
MANAASAAASSADSRKRLTQGIALNKVQAAQVSVGIPMLEIGEGAADGILGPALRIVLYGILLL